MRRITTLLTLMLMVAMVFNIGCKKKEEGEEKGGEVTITGSTTILPIMQRIAEVYMEKHPEYEISVSGGGSGVGITALLDGTADIAMASRTMKDKEWATAKEKQLDIKEVEIARDGIAVVLHPTNPVSGLTLEQLRDIYIGKTKNWKEVGGPDLDIVVVSRDSASGTFEVFNKKVLKDEKLRVDALMQASNAAVRSSVEGSEGAIGYIGLGYITGDVKPIKIDGVEPTEKLILSGEYPIARSLYLYLKSDAIKAANDVVDFVLSNEGQKIVREVGYIPLK
ncbi:MAG: phosphate ABC transporter substrate-binding protein [Candidatus Coatesbacteria bacterium]|nr:MAG: phosphate ABC transporter substrate-binding protein [Candidatus Coatesbacteria bacterium]